MSTNISTLGKSSLDAARISSLHRGLHDSRSHGEQSAAVPSARLLGADRSHPLIHGGLARAVGRPTFEYGERCSGTDHDDVALGVGSASRAQERIPEYLWRRAIEQNLAHVVICRDFSRKADGL